MVVCSRAALSRGRYVSWQIGLEGVRRSFGGVQVREPALRLGSILAGMAGRVGRCHNMRILEGASNFGVPSNS